MATDDIGKRHERKPKQKKDQGKRKSREPRNCNSLFFCKGVGQELGTDLGSRPICFRRLAPVLAFEKCACCILAFVIESYSGWNKFPGFRLIKYV